MDTRNIIAALIWAIVCAGSSYGHITDFEHTHSQFEVGQADANMSTSTTTEPKTAKPVSTDNVPDPETTSNKTVTVAATTKKPTNCMVPRKDNFVACFEALGKNAMDYVLDQNLTGFIDDICDVNRSKPLIECIHRHFMECPAFLNRVEVEVLEFGPYHIKDIQYFSSIDQMCSCATGLICIQELLKVKRTQRLTIQDSNSPWSKLPNYKVICDKDNFRYIGCVRSNLRQCQSPLTKRYGDDFTNEDAEDIKGLYDFSKEHCNTITNEDFTANYRCIEEKSTSNQFRQCVREADNLPSSKQICRIRDCVADNIEDKCNTDSSLVSLYIDAVNIYRRDSVRLLNKQCSSSSATDIGLSIAAIIISIFIVVVV